MKQCKVIFLVVILAVGLLTVFTLSRQDASAQQAQQPQAKQAAPQQTPATNDIIKPVPPITQGFFPCSTCHATMPANKTPRQLTFHTEFTLKHMPGGWCFSCHDEKNRDKLKLNTGDLIDYKDAMKLCAQCHGQISLEWQAGAHGKRTGMWNGQKVYENCLTCHDQHAPRFKTIQPLPAPMRPGAIKAKN